MSEALQRSPTQGAIAIVGSAGFLGRALTAKLDELERPQCRFTRSLPLIVEGQVDRRAESAACIVWLASSINPLIAESQPELVEADVRALTEAVEAVRKLASPPRFIYVSSGGTVYGSQLTPPYSEDLEARPTTSYGRAKLRLEEVVSVGLQDFIIARVSNVFGPGQPVGRGQGVVAHWLRALRRGEPLKLFGDPGTIRDYVYSMDVADALVAMAGAESPPSVINVGSGVGTTLAELLHSLIRIADLDRTAVEYLANRSFDSPATYLDISLAQTALKWSPSTSLEEGLRQCWLAVTQFGDPLP
jgi:UDP-glucose 4-epimerase